jgi:hypothetical protein
MIKKIIMFSVFIFTLFVNLSFAQKDIDSSDISTNIPELFNFHEIIYPIWHTAYPEKDIVMLQSYVDSIKNHLTKINTIVLPGILKEREPKWRDGLAELNKSAEGYYSAMNSTDTNAMLSAAENLHSCYEAMVKIVKPVPKEVESFHQLLYVIYHQYYPLKNYTELKSVINDLLSRANAIKEAKLSKRFENKKDKFISAAEELYTAVEYLKNKLYEGIDSETDKAVESMHTKYQNLEKIFD